MNALQKYSFVATRTDLKKIEELAYNLIPTFSIATYFDIPPSEFHNLCISNPLIARAVLKGEGRRLFDEEKLYKEAYATFKADPSEKNKKIYYASFQHYRFLHKRFTDFSLNSTMRKLVELYFEQPINNLMEKTPFQKGFLSSSLAELEREEELERKNQNAIQ